MLLKTMVALSLPVLLLASTTTNLVLTKDDFILSGGASFISGHGAPTGMALRSGSAGATTVANFPKEVLAPGSTVKEISFTYRYICGYGTDGSGHGSNISLSINDETLRVGGTVVYSSPPYNDYSYSDNSSNYSLPVHVHISGLSIPTSATYSRLQLGFSNNDRNLQLLIPLSVNVTCEGADKCFVPAPTQPTPAPLPPTPRPPATHTPWKSIGPSNIGDDINNGGEAGTIAGAASPSSNPSVMYMGGNNNAASSGVLKSVDKGKHWTKVNAGLFDTRIHDVFIVDDNGDHVMVGTPSGVFETLNGAQNWTYVTQTSGWGDANSFTNGTINGKKYLLVGTSAGIANVPFLTTPLVNETWNLIPSPPGHAAWRTNPVMVADYRDGKLLQNSVVGGCLWVGNKGFVHLATIINETAADWVFQLDQPCQSMAMDPNDADHFIVNNASNGAHVYESTDGGSTYHGCLNKRGAVMVAIDRQGWFYCGSEAGAFRNVNGCVNGEWEALFVRRTARRTGGVRDRVMHDYQRINTDFAGGVAFGSDQGLFIKNGTELQLISGNGDVNNNVIMHPAIAEGEEAGERCIVTALMDWSPVASWDSGKHWPSWQTPDDGSAMGYFGEGGGCFGVGQSKYVLCMHHHNIAFSSRCGKNMSRFIAPHGASVTPPVFTRKAGSRSEPAGPVYAMATMGLPPWNSFADKTFTCQGDDFRGDLGVHTSYSCLSHVDIGNEYGWYPDVNVAVWRGASDKHCYLCKLAGNSSTWNSTATKGDVSYALVQEGDEPEEDGDEDEDEDYEDSDGKEIWSERKLMKSFNEHMEKTRALEWSEDELIDQPTTGLQLDGSGTRYVYKSWNFGGNWTWIVLPSYLQTLNNFVVDPTNDTVLYGITSECIGRSYDQAETWEYCWDAPGLEGSFKTMVIKDSHTMLVMRNGAVPLRTLDGGNSWTPLGSVEDIARYSLNAKYSWSGKTLALSTVAGQTLVWISRDDGDTWVDESGDYTAMSGGISQWYDNTLYIHSMGQGISAKIFPE